MKIKVYDSKGKEQDSKAIDFMPEKFEGEGNILTQYVRVYSANQRQGTSKVKTRSEVSGGGKKPWRQKGTGRARVGSNRSPLWRSGGVIHGPTPKDWSIKMTKQVKSQAFLIAFAEKINNGNFSLFEADKNIKTKSASNLLKLADMNLKNILVLHDKNVEVYKSFRNLPNVAVQNIDEVNTFNILSADCVLLETGAFEAFKSKFFKD